MQSHSIVDVHSHFLAEAYVNARKETEGRNWDGGPAPDWTAQGHLAMMDENGIEMAILSSPELNFVSEQALVDLAREVNNCAASLIAAHPRRFGAFASLPLPDVKASLNEIDYALDELKLDGVGIHTNYAGAYLGDPHFRPVLEELHRRQTTVFVHPTEPAHFEDLGVEFPAPMLEYPFDTTRTVVSLVRSHVLYDLPGICWIVAHGGGAIPFLTQTRIAPIASVTLSAEAKKAGSDSRAVTPEDITRQIATLNFDLTAATTPEYLLSLGRLVPPSQLLAGFDYPFMPKQSIPPAITAICAYTSFSERDLAGIWNVNARRLLPRLNETENDAS